MKCFLTPTAPLLALSILGCGSLGGDARADDADDIGAALGGDARGDQLGTVTSASTQEAPLAWVGDTHLRYDGRWIPPRVVLSARTLDVYTQTWPHGAATRVELFWKTEDGVRSAAMTLDMDRAGATGENKQWRASIPATDLVAGRVVEYWIRAEGQDQRVVWDSVNGKNHRVTPREEVVLWDGGTPDLFRHAGRGGFGVEGDALVARPGDGLGLFWCTFATPPDFELSLEFRLDAPSDNSGVFLRFRDPETFGYENAAWAAVHDGLEVQIDELARPAGDDVHRTGALYGIGGQSLDPRPAHAPGEWSRYVIRVQGQKYTVDLDGHRVASLTYAGDEARPLRALASSAEAPRFVGVQSHTGRVAFRNIRLRSLSKAP